MRMVICLFLGSTSLLVARNLVTAQTTTIVSHSGAKSDEIQPETNLESLINAVIRVKTSSSNATSGVIVSNEGHVIWPGSAHEQTDLSVVLSSGETVDASNLGWSGEWQVGLLKLKGERKWTHARFGSTEEASVGDKCFEVGYHANENKYGFARRPNVRFGKITRVSPSHWFATNLPPKQFEYGTGTFGIDGRLLGISVPGVSNTERLSTAIEIFTSHWEPFTNGSNLDWMRYPPTNNSLYRMLAQPGQLERTFFIPRPQSPQWQLQNPTGEVGGKGLQTARKVAAATTVRLIHAKDENRCWSGVIVSPKGHIVTCAHTHQMTGDELIVVLPDNRRVPAVALGTNWVSDIGLAKITAEGPWNYAKIGDSSKIGTHDSVLGAGFPAPHVNPLPPVATDVLGLQLTPYVGWSQNLVLSLRQKLEGGSSGGGVFSRDGKLVAIYLGPGDARRIEVFQAQEEYLNAVSK